MSQINLKLLPIQKGRNINFEKGLKNMRFVYNYKKKKKIYPFYFEEM